MKFTVWSPPDGSTVHEFRCLEAKRVFLSLHYTFVGRWWESAEIQPWQCQTTATQTERHQCEFHHVGFGLRQPDVVASPWLHEVKFLNTFPPVLLSLALVLTELPDPSKSPHILSLLFWPPSLCLFGLQEEEVLSCGFLSLRAPTRGTAWPRDGTRGAFIAIQIRGSFSARRKLGHRNLNLRLSHAFQKTRARLQKYPEKKKNLQWVRSDGKAHRCRCELGVLKALRVLCFVTLYVDSSASQRRVLYCLHSSDNLNYKLPFFLCVFWPYW